MGTVFSYILLALVISLAVFAGYLLTRIIKIYLRAHRLDKMRSYETILYAALQKLGSQRTMNTLLPNPDPEILEEVLLRMGDEGAEGWKEKVIELYDLSGFTQERLRQLQSRFASRRSNAARRLGRVADPRAVPQLKGLLSDRKEEVREAAMYALGRIGTPESLEAMLEALDLGDRWTQEKVAESVEEIGDQSRPLILQLLRDGNPVRRAFAAEVMGGMGGLEEVPFLEEALADENVDVRARAADSLGKLKHRTSRAALLEALQDPEWQVRSQVVKALGQIGEEEDIPRLAEALRDPEWWVRNNAAAALREMGEAGEAPLVDALWDEDPFAREIAAQALEESSIVERAVEEMRGEKETPRADRIIHRLAEIGCMGTIKQVLSDLPDEEVKARLVYLLSDIRHPDLERYLARAARDSRRHGRRIREETTGGKEPRGASTPSDEESEW